MKKLVLYCSYDGNTEYICKYLANKINADIKEIVPKEKFTNVFSKYLKGGKQVVTKQTPEIEDIDIKIDNYDLIIIGTPVWASNYVPPIRTFITKYNIKNKKMAFISTYKGGPGKSLENLENVFSKKNKILGTIGIDSVLNQKEYAQGLIDNWIDEIGL